MEEKNMGWDCKCTNLHACDYHKECSFYRGLDDVGHLPIEYSKIIRNPWAYKPWSR